jgi:Putative zinc-finger
MRSSGGAIMTERYDVGEHAFAGPLLPWYVNDTLTSHERERVRQHLDTCSACRDDLQWLQRVRSAVCHSEATPMLSPAQPERLLEAIDRQAQRGRKLRRAGFAAGAAALATLIFVAGIVVSGLGDAPPAHFRTLTSEPRGLAMDYVLDLRFESGLTATDHKRVLKALQAKQVEPGSPDDLYRVTLTLAASSVSELGAFTRQIESMPEIRSARIVAMQLPMRQER